MRRLGDRPRARGRRRRRPRRRGRARPRTIAAAPASHTGPLPRARCSAPAAARRRAAPPRARDPPRGARRPHPRSSAPASTTCSDVSLELPRDRLIVVTGLSGSGKSTLAFDVLFAEGQRRYLDSLSTYARQFLQVMAEAGRRPADGPPADGRDRAAPLARRPHVDGRDRHRGLPLPPPALREARRAALPGCGAPIRPQTRRQIVDRLRARARAASASRCSRRSSAAARAIHKEVLARGAQAPASREARIDGKLVDARRRPAPRPLPRARHRPRVGDASRPSAHGRSTAALARGAPARQRRRRRARRASASASLASGSSAPRCGLGFEPLDPRLFSFNSRQGACPTCHGIGVVRDARPRRWSLDPTPHARATARSARSSAPELRGRAPRSCARSRAAGVPLDRPVRPARARASGGSSSTARRQRPGAARDAARRCSRGRGRPTLAEFTARASAVRRLRRAAPQRARPRRARSHGRTHRGAHARSPSTTPRRAVGALRFGARDGGDRRRRR